MGEFDLFQFRKTPYDLQFAFAGKMFKWELALTVLNGITNYQIKCSSVGITHFIDRDIRTVGNGISYTFSEKGIKTDGVGNQTIINVNRLSSGLPLTKILAPPTTSTGGVTAPIVLESVRLVPNTLTTQISPELILKSNTSYLLRISNSSNAALTSFSFVWYESNN